MSRASSSAHPTDARPNDKRTDHDGASLPLPHVSPSPADIPESRIEECTFNFDTFDWDAFNTDTALAERRHCDDDPPKFDTPIFDRSRSRARSRSRKHSIFESSDYTSEPPPMSIPTPTPTPSAKKSKEEKVLSESTRSLYRAYKLQREQEKLEMEEREAMGITEEEIRILDATFSTVNLKSDFSDLGYHGMSEWRRPSTVSSDGDTIRAPSPPPDKEG